MTSLRPSDALKWIVNILVLVDTNVYPKRGRQCGVQSTCAIGCKYRAISQDPARNRLGPRCPGRPRAANTAAWPPRPCPRSNCLCRLSLPSPPSLLWPPRRLCTSAPRLRRRGRSLSYLRRGRRDSHSFLPSPSCPPRSLVSRRRRQIRTNHLPRYVCFSSHFLRVVLFRHACRATRGRNCVYLDAWAFAR